MRPGLTTVGDYRTLVAITHAYYGALTLAVAVEGEHQGRVVTLRTLSLGRDASDAAVARVVAAAEASHRIQHDNIVPVLDMVRGYEETTLVNAYMDGAPLHILARMLMAGRVPPEAGTVVRLVADVLVALGFLHGSGDYVAGGLTPQCVWVCADGRARLQEPLVQGPLGAVAALSKHHERVAYRAPEQLGHAIDPDPRSDVFTIGVMLWELLQRKRLFAGFDAAAIAERITGSDAPKLDCEGTSEELAAVVATALARDPADRFADAAEMLAALMAASPAKAQPDAVAQLLEKLLGGHPSIQRVRDTAAKHQTAPSDATKASPATPPRAKLKRRALPTPVRPLTIPLRFNRPEDQGGEGAPGATSNEANQGSREPMAALDALLDSSSKSKEAPAAGDTSEQPPPPSTGPPSTGRPSTGPPSTGDSWMPADSVPPPNDAQVQEGARRQVGRCELFVEIAQGGMATVYLGRWVGAGGFAKLVAVKAMHPQYTGNPEFVSMFLDEARVVARVRHPNVMQTIDLVEADGDLFIVMDYAHGVTLGHLLRQMKRSGAKMPIPIALRVVHGVLQGLHAAHEATDEQGKAMNIVHRDVTPGNVMVGVDGHPRLIDFGVARALGRLTSSSSGVLKGKPHYLSPEQFAGDEVNRQTDVYSASVMLWQALTGRRAFKGDDMAAVGEQVLTKELAPPSGHRSGISGELDGVVLRGVARQREERWETAEQMADALVRAGELASHREVGDWVRQVAGGRLEQAAAVLQAVESAPIALDDDDIEEPLSVRAADRESLTHDVVFAAQQLGAPTEERAEAEERGDTESVTDVTSHTSMAHGPAPPEPRARRGLYLAGAAGAALLLAVAVYMLSGPSDAQLTSPAASTQTAPASAPTPTASEPAPAETEMPVDGDATSTAVEQALAPTSSATAPFPPMQSAAPLARPGGSAQPWPTATTTTTTTTAPETKTLPDGI